MAGIKYFIKQILIIVIGFLAVTILIAISGLIKDTTQESIKINDIQIYIERAVTQKEQAKGLGGRELLPKDSGMLFVYNSPAVRLFWMKDMLFPIDIIWIDESKKIINITKNISQDSFPERFSSEMPALYVLEVNAGFVDENSIFVGDFVDI